MAEGGDAVTAPTEPQETVDAASTTLLTAIRQTSDELLHQHEAMVGLITHLLATALGHDVAAAAELSYAASLHDVGRSAMSGELFAKDGALTEDEIAEIRLHTSRGGDLLLAAGFDPGGLAVQAALHHHERFDGSGYPQGSAGDAIPLVARLVAVADVYDALRAARPYKPAFDHAAVCRILLEGDGRCDPAHFDPAILAAFRDNAEVIRRLWSPTGGA